MQPALAQVSTLNASFELDVADYAAGQCRAIELWLGKIEQYLEKHSLPEVGELLATHNVAAPVAAYQGGLLVSQGDARREHWEHFRRRLVLCRALGVGTLVVAADLTGPLTATDIERALVSLAQAAAEAGQHEVRLALEFQARASLINNLQTAVQIVEQVRSPHLGICLDLFHYYTGPSKPEDFDLLTGANLFHVQLCDLAGTMRELATDSDRVLPGDGDFAIRPLVERLQRLGYSGHVSIELMNPHIWQIPPLQFGEIAMTALRQVLGQASMGDAVG